MAKAKSQTSAAIMLRSLLKLVISLTLALAVVIIVAVGHQLLAAVTHNTTTITNSLKQAVIDGDDDWETWRKNSTLDTSASYVYVHNMRKDAKVTHYFSPNADDILEVKPVKVPLIAHLYYRPGFGFLYHRQVHAKGIYYTLWQNMGPQLAVLGRVIEATLVVLVITLGLAPWYIRRLTHHLTSPIRDLSTNTKVIAGAADPDTMTLPVPTQPTEVRELAENFNALLAQLNHRAEQQKLFVMNAAHELRTPIATIRSHAQLIERHGQDHPEIIPKSVTFITAESRQMQQLIEELLALSRADRLMLTQAPVELAALVQATVTKLTATFSQSFTVVAPASLTITTNAGAIEQILNSLLSNAAKYAPADSAVTVTLAQTATAVSLAVADAGPGVAEEDRKHLFERFYRGAAVRGTVAGTGLGLAIANQLTTLLGGTLTVAANHPSGSIFTLTLPQA